MFGRGRDARTSGTLDSEARETAPGARIALRGGTPALLPPEMLEAFKENPSIFGMPSDIDLVLAIDVKSELIDDTSRGWTSDFAAWLATEYPKALLDKRLSGHTIRKKDLMRAYEVTIETVYHKYRHASGGRGPYPVFRKTSGLVRFFSSEGRQIASWTFGDSSLPPHQLWLWVIEHTLDAVVVRRRNGKSAIRCGWSKWTPISHTAAFDASDDAARKRTENRISLFARLLPFFSRPPF